MKGGLYNDPLTNEHFNNPTKMEFMENMNLDPTKPPWFRLPPGEVDEPMEWMREHREAAVNALSKNPMNEIKLKTKKSRAPAGFTGQKYNKSELNKAVEEIKVKFQNMTREELFENMTREELFAFYFIRNKMQIIEEIEKDNLSFRAFYGFMGEEVYKILKDFYQI